MFQVELGLSSIGISPLDIKEVPFVTDEAANYRKAFETYRRIGCLAHQLNTVLRHTFNEDLLAEKAPQTLECITANKKAIKYLKKSCKSTSLDGPLHAFFFVRFNSLCRSLKSTFDQYVEVIDLLNTAGEQGSFL